MRRRTVEFSRGTGSVYQETVEDSEDSEEAEDSEEKDLFL
jgi:hypothetical protein